MSDEVQASHILVSNDGRTDEEALESINKIKAEIDADGDFADLARRHSDCPSGARGGDLGSFGKGVMVAEFEKAAFDLDKGAISEPVETQFGYHLIHRTG